MLATKCVGANNRTSFLDPGPPQESVYKAPHQNDRVNWTVLRFEAVIQAKFVTWSSKGRSECTE